MSRSFGPPSWVTVALLAALVCAASARAQITPASQSESRQAAQEQRDTAGTPRRPASIPVPEIARRAEQATASLRGITARATAEAEVIRIAEQLPETARRLERLRDVTDVEEFAGLSRSRLSSMRQEWERYRSQLDGWQERLERRLRVLLAASDTLERQRGIWERTREEAAARGELPVAVDQRIRGVLNEIASVEERLRERINAILTLQNRIADEEVDVTEVLARLERAQQEARQQLLAPDSPPIWRALATREAEFPLIRRLVDSTRSGGASLSLFLRDYQSRILLQVLLFLILIAVMYNLRRRARDLESEGLQLGAASSLLSRPVSAALLIALLLTRRFYPAAPQVVPDITTVVMLVPVIRLLSSVAYASVRGALYAVAALFVADRVVTLGLEGSLVGRLVLLLVTCLALVGLVWFMRPEGALRDLRDKRGWRVAVGLSRAGYLILGASILANVFGVVALSELLTTATLRSVYLAILLLAAVLVLEAVVRVVLHTRAARALNAIRLKGDLVYRRVSTLLGLAGIVLWVISTLWLFGVAEPVGNALLAVLAERLTIGEFDISLGDVLAFFFALWLAVLASKLIRFLLEEDVLARIDLPRGVPGTLSMLVNYVVLTIGFIIAIAMAGIDLNRFALVAGALGVGIGFGLQNVVNNFVSGLILIFERPIHIGDTIEVGTLIGTVKRIGIRASVVRTFEGAEVIVPNGNLLAGELVNWTYSDRQRRIELPVGVSYGTDPQKVLDLLVEVAKKHPEILAYPAPMALFRGFGDSSLDFELRAWTAEFDNWFRVGSEVRVRIHQALKEAGIEIPFPQRDLHFRSVAPAVRDAIGGADGARAGRLAPASPEDGPDGEDSEGRGAAAEDEPGTVAPPGPTKEEDRQKP